MEAATVGGCATATATAAVDNEDESSGTATLFLEQQRRYEACGQGHVFEFYDALSSSEKESLLEQLASIPVEELKGLLASAQAVDGGGVEGKCSVIEPFVETSATTTTTSEDAPVSYYWNKGLEAIGRGEVAALVLAGGQGTRLGFDGPKGMYDIGLPSHKSLFQLISERLVKLQQLAAATVTAGAASAAGGEQALSSPLPFYIMTSPMNHQATKDYFSENDYFGLGDQNVFIFQQGLLPCLSYDQGKLIMETASKVAMSPDGNGGIYSSLLHSGALDHMMGGKNKNIQYLHVFSIDNAVVRPADPTFVGYCLHRSADCGNKSTRKAHAHETVGVIALRNGKPCVVEYSEITKEMAEQVNDQNNNQLVFGSGNICNHFYTLDFIRTTVLPNLLIQKDGGGGEGLAYHIAHNKRIPSYSGSSSSTSSTNGMKLERFIFDVFPLSKRFVVWEVDRTEEFAPVKNAPGSASDTPETARAIISALSQKWLQAAGATLIHHDNDNNNNNNNNNNSDNDNAVPLCEISPLVSYAGEGLEEYQGKTIQLPFCIL